MAQPYAPTAAEVKGVIPQRIDGRAFSADTIPTVAEVDMIIADVADEVAALSDEAIPVTFHPLARYAVKVGAAAAVERTFWPEQPEQSDLSTYERLERKFEALKSQLQGQISGGESELGSMRIRSPMSEPIQVI